MSRNIITKLTTQEEELSLLVKQKWLNLLKQPLDKEKVTKIINKIYQNEKYESPEIIFTDSPRSAYQILKEQKKNNKIIGSQIHTFIDEEIEQNLRQQTQKILSRELQVELYSRLTSPVWDKIYYQFWLFLKNKINKQFGKKKPKISFNIIDMGFACYCDFAKQIGVDFNQEEYEIYT